ESIAIAAGTHQNIEQPVGATLTTYGPTGNSRINLGTAGILPLAEETVQPIPYQVLLQRLFIAAGQPRRQPQKNIPVRQLALRQGQNRRCPLGNLAYHVGDIEKMEIGVGELRRAGQDYIRVARGLVEVDIHGKHEIQVVEGLVEAT